MGIRRQEFIRENIGTYNNFTILTILICSAKILIFRNLKEATERHFFLLLHHLYTIERYPQEMRK